jgi:lipid A 4'-phosphatase
MNYLRLRRGRLILGSFLVFALLMLTFPGIDLYISGAFYDGKSFLKDQWWQKILQEGLGYFLGVSFSLVVAAYLCNRLLKTHICDINGRKVAYLFLVGIIGAGLIVNVAFKNNFGRARPRDVAEFGGAKQFTPPFIPTRQCRTNCSFSSGDAAGAFFSLALVTALSRRRRYLGAAVGFGILVSLGRVSAGAHFFSDTVTSFFVMLFVSDVLYHYLVLDGRERHDGLLMDDSLVAAYATLPARSDTPARIP